MKNTSDKSCREIRNTRFMFNDLFFSETVPLVRKCGKKQSGVGNR